MKFSKIFTAATIFFMLLFIPTNIYAAANDTVTLEYKDNRRFNPRLANASSPRKKVYLKVGTQSQLYMEENVSDKTLSWKSSKKRIVSINQKTGKIKALRGGSSLITAKTKSGYTTEYVVIVYERLIHLPEPLTRLPEPSPNIPFIVSYS